MRAEIGDPNVLAALADPDGDSESRASHGTKQTSRALPHVIASVGWVSSRWRARTRTKPFVAEQQIRQRQLRID